MSAAICEKCGAEAKTYWVGDKEWLCAGCFKKAKLAPVSIKQFASGLQLDDEDEDA